MHAARVAGCLWGPTIWIDGAQKKGKSLERETRRRIPVLPYADMLIWSYLALYAWLLSVLLDCTAGWDESTPLTSLAVFTVTSTDSLVGPLIACSRRLSCTHRHRSTALLPHEIVALQPSCRPVFEPTCVRSGSGHTPTQVNPKGPSESFLPLQSDPIAG